METKYLKYRFGIYNHLCCLVWIKDGTPYSDMYHPDAKSKLTQICEKDKIGVLVCHLNPDSSLEDRLAYVYVDEFNLRDARIGMGWNSVYEDFRKFEVTPKIMYGKFSRKEFGKHNMHVFRIADLEYQYPNAVCEGKIMNDGKTFCYRSNEVLDKSQPVPESEVKKMGLITKTDPYNYLPIRVTWTDGSFSWERIQNLVFCHQV